MLKKAEDAQHEHVSAFGNFEHLRAERTDPEALATRYRAGSTMRQIGADVGLSHFTVRYHLRKLKGYRSMGYSGTEGPSPSGGKA